MSSFLPANLPAILAWLVIFTAVPLLWLAVLGFTVLLKDQPHNRILRAQWLWVLWSAWLVTVFGVVFLNNDTVPPRFTLYETQVMTRSAVYSVVIPTLYSIHLLRPVILARLSLYRKSK